jgi:hypothetical protein
MDSVLVNLIPVLAANVVSSNSQIRSESVEVFETLTDCLSDKNRILMIQTLSNIIQFGSQNNALNSPKVKAILLEKMTGKRRNLHVFIYI